MNTDIDALIERLREDCFCCLPSEPNNCLHCKAADALERLAAEKESMRKTALSFVTQVDRQAAKAVRYKAALNEIKDMVCGEARPNWSIDSATTATRGWIADRIDKALTTGDTP